MFWWDDRKFVAFFALLSIGVFCSHALDCEVQLNFWLNTPSNMLNEQELKTSGAAYNISESHFDARRPTRIFIHGYNSYEKLLNRFREYYMVLGAYNFIAVDWIASSCTYNYLTAVGHITSVS